MSLQKLYLFLIRFFTLINQFLFNGNYYYGNQFLTFLHFTDFILNLYYCLIINLNFIKNNKC